MPNLPAKNTSWMIAMRHGIKPSNLEPAVQLELFFFPIMHGNGIYYFLEYSLFYLKRSRL